MRSPGSFSQSPRSRGIIVFDEFNASLGDPSRVGRANISSPGIITDSAVLELCDEAGAGIGSILTLEAVAQRNWSRISLGTVDTLLPGQTGHRVFVKQFVDAGGQAHSRQWDFEREGADIARSLMAGCLHIPVLLWADSRHLLHVYEFCELISLDDMLRKDVARFDATLPAALAAMRVALDQLATATEHSEVARALPCKERPYGGASTAVNFKGLDIRNVGLMDDDGDAVRFAMFDFGRPYLSPIEEAAAKLFVSVGLLNWGRPIRRFARGPDAAALAAANAQLGHYLDLDAVLNEIHYQQRTRERDVKARGRTIAALKKLGLNTLGKLYFHRLETWCRDTLTKRQTR